MTVITKFKRYFGMHFYDGIAGYTDPDTNKKFNVYVNEQTIREMDADFQGCPVFVEHVDEVDKDISRLRADADGVVVRSFFNEADGKHWAEFMVQSEEGEEAIRRGARLSNCYVPTQEGPGGICNGVDYDKQMVSGKYHHLALVKRPRYQESVILTPEQFSEYNEGQVKDLQKYANHLVEEAQQMSGLNFWSKTKIANSSEIENHVVELPKTKRHVSIKQLCNEADEPTKADMKMMVTVDGEDITLGELISRYTTLKTELSSTDNEDDDEGGEDDSVENTDDNDKTKTTPPPKKTENSRTPPPKKRTPEEIAAAKAAAKAANDAIKNSANDVVDDDDDEFTIETSGDKRALGRSRYGSLKK